MSEIGDEIVDMLDSDRQADQAVIDAERCALRRRHRRVGHARGKLEETLDASERLGEGEDLGRSAEPLGPCEVGAEPDFDLAILRLEGSPRRGIPAGISKGLRVGQKVYAVGNPFGLDQTLTQGIVRAGLSTEPCAVVG